MNVIKKAVFPVAGLGSRFLPATKATPKEMLPIVDKPLIQFALEEAAAAGITDFIFITNHSKHAIENHFDRNHELEWRLQEKNNARQLEIVKQITPEHVNCIYIRQSQPLGLGHAVLAAAPIIGDDPFAVLLADDLIDSSGLKNSCLKDMVAAYEQCQSSVVAVQELSTKDLHKYGIVDIDQSSEPLTRIKTIVEKPTAETAPSHFGAIGRYILESKIFEPLRELVARNTASVSNEIQLTDAIAMLAQSAPVYAFKFSGKRYDCGSKLGYLQATVEYGLRHPECGNSFATYLKNFYQNE